MLKNELPFQLPIAALSCISGCARENEHSNETSVFAYGPHSVPVSIVRLVGIWRLATSISDSPSIFLEDGLDPAVMVKLRYLNPEAQFYVPLGGDAVEVVGRLIHIQPESTNICESSALLGKAYIIEIDAHGVWPLIEAQSPSVDSSISSLPAPQPTADTTKASLKQRDEQAKRLMADCYDNLAWCSGRKRRKTMSSISTLSSSVQASGTTTELVSSSNKGCFEDAAAFIKSSCSRESSVRSSLPPTETVRGDSCIRNNADSARGRIGGSACMGSGSCSEPPKERQGGGATLTDAQRERIARNREMALQRAKNKTTSRQLLVQQQQQQQQKQKKPPVCRSTNGTKPGDWTCQSCGARVFASKLACFKCGILKGNTAADAGATTSASSHSRTPADLKHRTQHSMARVSSPPPPLPAPSPVRAAASGDDEFDFYTDAPMSQCTQVVLAPRVPQKSNLRDARSPNSSNSSNSSNEFNDDGVLKGGHEQRESHGFSQQQADLSAHAVTVLQVIESAANQDDADELNLGSLEKRVRGGRGLLEAALEDLMLAAFIYQAESGVYKLL